MMRLAAALLALSAAPALAQPAGEWLAPSDRETLDAIETGRIGPRTKIVYVGRGETERTWTRRITTWSSPGYAIDRAAFVAQAARIREEVIADCPGIRAGEMRLFEQSGRAAAEYLIVCPLLPATDRPDIYLVRGIAGASGPLWAAITFRRPPTEAETEGARAYLDSLVLCPAARDEPACRR
jgi:hypothetical protein